MLCIQYSGWGITNASRECSRLARVFVGLGVDKVWAGWGGETTAKGIFSRFGFAFRSGVTPHRARTLVGAPRSSAEWRPLCGGGLRREAEASLYLAATAKTTATTKTKQQRIPAGRQTKGQATTTATTTAAAAATATATATATTTTTTTADPDGMINKRAGNDNSNSKDNNGCKVRATAGAWVVAGGFLCGWWWWG